MRVLLIYRDDEFGLFTNTMLTVYPKHSGGMRLLRGEKVMYLEIEDGKKITSRDIELVRAADGVSVEVRLKKTFKVEFPKEHQVDAPLHVGAVPAGTKVVVDGELVGELEEDDPDLELSFDTPGTWSVRLERDGYVMRSETVAVKP